MLLLVPCVRFQELVQSTDVEELLPEAELARLRAELGQEGESPMAADVIEQVCVISGGGGGGGAQVCGHVCMQRHAPWHGWTSCTDESNVCTFRSNTTHSAALSSLLAPTHPLQKDRPAVRPETTEDEEDLAPPGTAEEDTPAPLYSRPSKAPVSRHGQCLRVVCCVR